MEGEKDKDGITLLNSLHSEHPRVKCIGIDINS